MGRLALFCSREHLFPPSVGGGGRETSLRGEGEVVNPGSLARCENHLVISRVFKFNFKSANKWNMS